MKCLTYAECEAWLGSFGVAIAKNRQLLFLSDIKRQYSAFIENVSLEPHRLDAFSRRVIDWMPNGCHRLLWLSNWETYPANQTFVFEMLRSGTKETRHIIDAPGQLFTSSAYDRTEYESRTAEDERENALMSGFFLLMLCFSWGGYLVAHKHDCHIILDDNRIGFYSSDVRKMEEARMLASDFGIAVTVS